MVLGEHHRDRPVYLGPLVLLLSQAAKRSRRFLGGVALLVLVGMWVERWWLVTPTLGGPMTLSLAELAAAAGARAKCWITGRSIQMRISNPCHTPRLNSLESICAARMYTSRARIVRGPGVLFPANS